MFTPAQRAPRRLTALLGLTIAGLTMTACGAETKDSATDSDAPWATSANPIDRAGLAWASAGVVHLPDGSTLDIGQELDSYVLAGDGVYSVHKGQIWFTKPGDEPVNTKLKAAYMSLRTSADGRYLGWIDDQSGTRDEYDTPQQQGVVWDLKHGREVLRTSEGMGDPATDDLADLYEDAGDGYIVFEGSAKVAVHQVGEGQTAWKLGGDAKQLPEAPSEFAANDSWAVWNATHTWKIDGASAGLATPGEDPSVADMEYFGSTDGAVVYPGPKLDGWDLVDWIDDTTAVGWLYDTAGHTDDQYSTSLMTCEATTGKCTPVPDTKDREITLPGA